jgi:hypothetical protein
MWLIWPDLFTRQGRGGHSRTKRPEGEAFAEPVRCYKVLGIYHDLVEQGIVIREERDGFRFLLDLQKHDKAGAIKTPSRVSTAALDPRQACAVEGVGPAIGPRGLTLYAAAPCRELLPLLRDGGE